jgi:hypothetical protein
MSLNCTLISHIKEKEYIVLVFVFYFLQKWYPCMRIQYLCCQRTHHTMKVLISRFQYCGLWWWCVKSFSTIFHWYCGDQSYWCRKPKHSEKKNIIIDVAESSRVLGIGLSDWGCNALMMWVQIPSSEIIKCVSSKS